MQRGMPLPRIQSAQGWSGSRGRNALRRGVGREGLTVDATGHTVAAHPIRAGLGKVAGTGSGSSSWVHGDAKVPCSEGVQREGEAPPLPSVLCTHNTPPTEISASSAICNRRRGRCHKLPDSANARQPNHVTIRYWPSATNGARNTGGAVTVSPIAATVIRAATARTDL
jgi:hypothetical protein